MTEKDSEQKEILIASITPYFLERGILSFALLGSFLKTLRF
jgi:hypothetical protein